MKVESIEGKKLNKGEWAEFYVLLKLLGEGRLYTADSKLRKDSESFLDILKVIRQEDDTSVLEYVIDRDNNQVVINEQGKGTLDSIPAADFADNAQILFDGINKTKGNSVPAPKAVCDFAKEIYVSKPKAPSVKTLKKQFGGKSDIFIEARDGKTSVTSVMGFSIKSRFGQNPTLFNAGSSSQFLYKLENCNDELMTEFNAISDGGGRGWGLCKEYLLLHGITMQFTQTQNPIYNDNLFLVRESMSKILAWCAKDRLIDSQSDYEVLETVKRMTAANPLHVPNAPVYYEKAMKDFLMAGFTGMTAGKVWDGKEQVNGGYIVVMDDGDVLCYHSNDREAFRDYLYKNTYFEYVSADKYCWSRIQKIDGEYYLPLNISVRFNKKIR
ncbi:MAG: HpaII family restriction endonuclease [Lachnospiraceae bacterium]|nr:HpaII family restriction endonuclease [Lachnospiraceae bacterium]